MLDFFFFIFFFPAGAMRGELCDAGIRQNCDVHVDVHRGFISAQHDKWYVSKHSSKHVYSFMKQAIVESKSERKTKKKEKNRLRCGTRAKWLVFAVFISILYYIFRFWRVTFICQTFVKYRPNIKEERQRVTDKSRSLSYVIYISIIWLNFNLFFYDDKTYKSNIGCVHKLRL